MSATRRRCDTPINGQNLSANHADRSPKKHLSDQARTGHGQATPCSDFSAPYRENTCPRHIADICPSLVQGLPVRVSAPPRGAGTDRPRTDHLGRTTYATHTHPVPNMPTPRGTNQHPIPHRLGHPSHPPRCGQPTTPRWDAHSGHQPGRHHTHPHPPLAQPQTAWNLARPTPLRPPTPARPTATTTCYQRWLARRAATLLKGTPPMAYQLGAVPRETIERQLLRSWLAANRINPDHVPAGGELSTMDGHITYTRVAEAPCGHAHVEETTVPMMARPDQTYRELADSYRRCQRALMEVDELLSGVTASNVTDLDLDEIRDTIKAAV